MATAVRLLGWKASGLRCPDHEVNFERERGSVYPVTLVQMPNGTGKTTTLDLLRATLSGAARNWTRDRVASLRKRRPPADRGLFEVALLSDSRRVTIRLILDFESGSATYETTARSGMDRGFEPPHDLRKFLREGFVRFFVFDGELAEHLLNGERTDAQSAVEDLFQLTTFEHLQAAVGAYWESQTKGRTAKEMKGLNRRRNNVEKLRERLQELQKEYGERKNECARVGKELARAEQRFSDAIKAHGQYRDRLAKAEDQLEKAKQKVATTSKEILLAFRDPHALSGTFAAEMVALKSNLDRVKLPESAAREFFQELAEEAHCVCGRELDDETRRALLSRAKGYLGSDDVSLLNAIKKDVTDFVGADVEEHEAIVVNLVARLKEFMRLEAGARAERDRVRAEASRDDPELEKAKQRIAELTAEEKRLEDEVGKYEDKSEGAPLGIRAHEVQLEKAENDLAEITHTLGLKAKRDVLIETLGRARERARSQLCAEVQQEANERIGDLMPDNSIRIGAIDRSLKLEGQETGSVGENLSVAYAFLSTLFNRSEHTLPFIVDSPANPIDVAVRRKVGGLVPRLTDQFVGFVISSEREGFLGSLERSAGATNVQFLTLFRKGPKDLESRARQEESVEETADGLMVSGKGFFTEFHRDEESEDAVQVA